MAINLEDQFDNAMMDIYRRANTEARYDATRFFQMLTEHRGVETARILLNSEAISAGYAALWERKRLDLTVEALIHDYREYHSLFSDREREIARRRLMDYKYVPALDPVERFIGAFQSDLANWAEQHDRHLGQEHLHQMSDENAVGG